SRPAMTAGASKAAPTTIQQPALVPSPQPRPAPTGRALPPNLAAQGGQNWTPIRGQIWAPIDNSATRTRITLASRTIRHSSQHIEKTHDRLPLRTPERVLNRAAYILVPGTAWPYAAQPESVSLSDVRLSDRIGPVHNAPRPP